MFIFFHFLYFSSLWSFFYILFMFELQKTYKDALSCNFSVRIIVIFYIEWVGYPSSMWKYLVSCPFTSCITFPFVYVLLIAKSIYFVELLFLIFTSILSRLFFGICIGCITNNSYLHFVLCSFTIKQFTFLYRDVNFLGFIILASK